MIVIEYMTLNVYKHYREDTIYFLSFDLVNKRTHQRIEDIILSYDIKNIIINFRKYIKNEKFDIELYANIGNLSGYMLQSTKVYKTLEDLEKDYIEKLI